MSSEQAKRIEANCKIIWGDDIYDIDLETDDYIWYTCIVKKDFGDAFGPPLTMTGLCHSSEHAYRELDRMLKIWAGQVKIGQPMTKEQKLDVFGGPNGRNKPILRKLIAEMEKRGIGN